MRLFSANKDPEHNFSRLFYATTFFGLIDFAAIAPYYVQQILTGADVSFDASIFRVLRLFRIFQLEHFMEAFTKLDDVYRECRYDTSLFVWPG